MGVPEAQRQRDRIGHHRRERAHPRHRPEREHSEIDEALERSAQRREDEQRHGGRSGQPVQRSDPQRPERDRPRAAEHAQQRRLGVNVRMGVDVTAVLVRVAVERRAFSVIVIGEQVPGRRATELAQRVAQPEHPEGDDGGRHHELESGRQRLGQRDVEEDDAAAGQRQRHGVTEAPQHADQHAVAEPPRARHDRGHRHQMIGVRRMLEPQDEAERDRGTERRHVVVRLLRHLEQQAGAAGVTERRRQGQMGEQRIRGGQRESDGDRMRERRREAVVGAIGVEKMGEWDR